VGFIDLGCALKLWVSGVIFPSFLYLLWLRPKDLYSNQPHVDVFRGVSLLSSPIVVFGAQAGGGRRRKGGGIEPGG